MLLLSAVTEGVDEGRQGRKGPRKVLGRVREVPACRGMTLGPAPEAGAADERKGLSELGYSVVKEHRITGPSPLKV